MIPAVALALVLTHAGPRIALSVHQQPGNPQRILVGTTFGAILSEDQGKTWHWLCEEALGNYTALPTFHLAQDGALYVASLKGLAVSRDHGCTWTPRAELTETGATAISGALAEPDILYATTGKFGVTNRLFKSIDRGATFTATPLADAKQFFTSIKVAPSRPQRLYLGAYWYEPSYTSQLVVSDDAGATFTRIDLTLPSPGPFYVHAVDPQNPDRVFASVDGTTQPAQTYFLISTDGGLSFATALTSPDQISNVTLKGDQIWVGTLGVLHRSDDGGKTFTAQPSPRKYAAVELIGDDLFSTGWPSLDGWVVGRNNDGGSCFDPVMQWRDLKGPLACPAGSTVREICEPLWPATEAQFPQYDESAGCNPATETDAGEPVVPTPQPKGCGCSHSSASLAFAGLLFALRPRKIRG
jgi:photosystem II stability/assembly factor-like uncharacterized protein